LNKNDICKPPFERASREYYAQKSMISFTVFAQNLHLAGCTILQNRFLPSSFNSGVLADGVFRTALAQLCFDFLQAGIQAAVS